MGARAERAAAGIVTKQKTAPLPAPFLVHLRVESAHFDWRWRERPALALLAWEAMARDPLARLRRIQVESIGTTINLGQRLLPICDIAASYLMQFQNSCCTGPLQAVGSVRGIQSIIAEQTTTAIKRKDRISFRLSHPAFLPPQTAQRTRRRPPFLAFSHEARPGARSTAMNRKSRPSIPCATAENEQRPR
jgi:hypothetical protein